MRKTEEVGGGGERSGYLRERSNSIRGRYQESVGARRQRSTSCVRLLCHDVTLTVAVAYFVVVGRELLQELLDPVLLTDAVQVRYLIFGKSVHVLMYLKPRQNFYFIFHKIPLSSKFHHIHTITS